MKAPFQVRLANTEDAASISRLLHKAFFEFKPLYTPGGYAATTLTAEHVLTRMQEGPVWLASRDDEPLGTVAAVLRERSLYVRGMAVLPTERGLGVGEKLLREVEHFANEQSCTLMFLSTTPFLHAAIRLYEKHGFQRRDESPQDLFGTPLFTMEKKISTRH